MHQGTAYASGRLGWATQFPRYEQQGPASMQPRNRDYVWDTADAAFRLDLPNGAYEVTSYFCSAEGVRHQIHMLTNDRPHLDRLIIPAGNDIVEHTSTVTVTQGSLTLVIYTPRKRVPAEGTHNHWIWNGLSVTELASP